MIKILRFVLTACFIVGVLSLNVEEKPVFHYVYKYSKLVVGPVQRSTQEFMKVSYHRTIHFSRQFFNNNLPATDSLDYQLSAPDRAESDYSESDKKKLDDIFGN
jgi:hypothetical protein